jgi:hypothetical protein
MVYFENSISLVFLSSYFENAWSKLQKEIGGVFVCLAFYWQIHCFNWLSGFTCSFPVNYNFIQILQVLIPPGAVRPENLLVLSEVVKITAPTPHPDTLYQDLLNVK